MFNEAATVIGVLERLCALALPTPLELIVVNDGSHDATPALLDDITDDRVVVIHHEHNRGKGAAVRTGLARATGTHLLVFDADTEYWPEDIVRLVAPILDGRGEVVYGVRVLGHNMLQPSLIHALGNKAMTMVANILYGSAIHDLHTCLKLLPLPLLRAMELHEEGFGLDTEISAELLRRGFRPFEVPVSYIGRTRAEGKKIALRDAFVSTWVMIAVRARGYTAYGARDRTLAPRVYVDPPASSPTGART